MPTTPIPTLITQMISISDACLTGKWLVERADVDSILRSAASFEEVDWRVSEIERRFEANTKIWDDESAMLVKHRYANTNQWRRFLWSGKMFYETWKFLTRLLLLVNAQLKIMILKEIDNTWSIFMRTWNTTVRRICISRRTLEYNIETAWSLRYSDGAVRYLKHRCGTDFADLFVKRRITNADSNFVTFIPVSRSNDISFLEQLLERETRSNFVTTFLWIIRTEDGERMMVAMTMAMMKIILMMIRATHDVK